MRRELQSVVMRWRRATVVALVILLAACTPFRIIQQASPNPFNEASQFELLPVTAEGVAPIDLGAIDEAYRDELTGVSGILAQARADTSAASAGTSRGRYEIRTRIEALTLAPQHDLFGVSSLHAVVTIADARGPLDVVNVDSEAGAKLNFLTGVERERLLVRTVATHVAGYLRRRIAR